MNCIRTGARVYLSEYNQTVPADIFQVGGCLVFHCNMSLFDTPDSNYSREGATHQVYIGDGYWNKAKGVIVVPDYQVEVQNGLDT